ncbi:MULTISPECIES: potassium channel family protein [Aequorivita]|uniref:Potassium channel protein n=1 Tax=Aequorivita iocasae TaxID=2803865 RepID=A0ABX7DP06_9FLAO|nr:MULTISPECIES: potassium channel protein [Aequorivita]PHR11069.1 MAG: potassium channel protein [Aequorivita sp.]QQX75550.1 potassium channel protein [Aequorivita iocasae]UCA55005.1 NAD-binding protein [Aequorivita sp. F7]
MRQMFNSKIAVALFLLLVVFMTGVIGFRFFSDYSWIDAFYMTVITITTVGYGEVMPLSPGEKVFVSLLIISSIFIVGYAISVITEYILSKNIGILRQKKVQKKLESMHGHIIVCGYGRNGKQAVQKLLAYKRPFVIIEKDEEVIDRFSDEKNLFILGNAIEDDVLLKAGIKKASTLICATPNDADNLFIVLSARQMNKNLKIISRASEETSYKKLKLGGADNVIMPDKIGGDHMASLVVVPDLVEFLDNLTVSGQHDSINVEQIPFENMCPDGKEQAIKELDVRKKTGCSIIGYRSPTGEYIVNPEPSLVLQKSSKLILIGRPEQIENLKREYGV